TRWMDLDAYTPSFRLDLHPFLYQSVALLTLVFELSFIIAIFFPRLRILAVLIGLGFHLSSGIFMQIPFLDLWMCYVAFIDVNSLVEAARRKVFRGRFASQVSDHLSAPAPDASPTKARSWLPIAALGTLLLCANTYFGINGIIRGWPFACYPRFAWNPGEN